MYFGTPAQEAIIEYNKEKDPAKGMRFTKQESNILLKN